MVDQIRGWLDEAATCIRGIDATEVGAAVRALRRVRTAGRTIFTVGNGGSASTASHFALDLQKAARPDGSGTRAIALSDNVGLITAWANDAAFDRVFAEQLHVLGLPGDALVLISVSGASPNLLAAAAAARDREMTTVGFLGKDGGPLRARVDYPVVVRSHDYGWVESAHVILEHVVTYALRDGIGMEPATH
jgi:D-sedoheptulose 7-phosphate isomerase